MNIKKDDKVVVLSGKDKGKQGKVLIADPKGGKVVAEGINVATKHQKPRTTRARSSLYAPSAARRHASATRSRTARKSVSARSAAQRSEEGAEKI